MAERATPPDEMNSKPPAPTVEIARHAAGEHHRRAGGTNHRANRRAAREHQSGLVRRHAEAARDTDRVGYHRGTEITTTPETNSVAPAENCGVAAEPPGAMIAVPPDATVSPTASPDGNTTARPPELTVVLLAVPEVQTYSTPPALTWVPLATPAQ